MGDISNGVALFNNSNIGTGKMKKRGSTFYLKPVQLPRSKRDTGLKAAQLGGTLGARFGPWGLIGGAVAGFAIGLVIDEVLDG
ncbi:hypothetical protein [Vibrio vulnificus]|uniref:hypothetical protein n=2 Tax=Vibrio vulnificus TaxID=672 RepID=UPI004059AAD1